MDSKFLAHPNQFLVKHLLGVAQRAKGFAAHFQGENHAELAGLLHDLGKADESFRSRMEAIRGNKKDPGGKQPHAPHGAALALAHHLWPVAFAVYGHHAGLHDRSALQQASSKWSLPAQKCEGWLNGEVDWPAGTWPISDFSKTLPSWLEALTLTTSAERDAKMRAVEFYTRMLFSALVDADRLDTEEANPAEGSQANVLKRKAWRFAPECLAKIGAAESLVTMLATALRERVAAAEAKGASKEVLEVRARVLAACEKEAGNERGVFTLAVPTGGGKTLASIAFALHHIAHHNKAVPAGDPRRLRRIIVVIPYLNIIQQTTRELRMVFGDLIWAKDALDPVTGRSTKHPTKNEEGAWLENSDPNHRPLILEHHSQATDPVIKGSDTSKADKDSDGYDKERPLRQLAAENWDAPIVVTTSVQFFDSLFSRRPADARKLHNICQSVLIFDEVQTLPPLLLQPTLDALQELTAPWFGEKERDPNRRNEQRPYGCTALFCTATQPALDYEESEFPFGLENVRPIIRPETVKKYFADLKRVEYRGLVKDAPPPPMEDEALLKAMLAAPRQQALAILNTRQQARKLFNLLADKAKSDEPLRNAIFHLSTWMYPAHRLQVLAEATKRLSAGKPCLLVSTQCVEAGVDVDFPAV
jgi:CRISPR-associated endonuclease/helicase Cas3